MTLVKLPVKSPSLMLVLSLLEQQDRPSSESELLTDWLLAHIASDNLSQQLDQSGLSPELSTVSSLFSVAARLFITDIKALCGCGGETDSSLPRPLVQYLTQGRGLLLLSALQRTVRACSTFHQELPSVLLSLVSILQARKEEEEADSPQCSLLPPVTSPVYPGAGGSLTVTAVKKRSSGYRQNRVRRRAGRSSVFPEVFSSSPRGQLGENLTQWEASPSSDENHTEIPGPPGPQESQIKYIPINYFEYFDNADLDSDEFSQMTANLLPRPPPLALAEVKVGMKQVVESVLHILTSSLANRTDNMAPHNQAQLIQLSIVSCNLYSVSQLVTKYSRPHVLSVLLVVSDD